MTGQEKVPNVSIDSRPASNGMIIGIAGTLGAGKGTVVEYLKTRGFTHYSARAFLWEEVDRRGLARVRDNLSFVANELRAAHHAGYIVEQLFSRAALEGGDAVIESLHTIGEAEFLKAHGAFILGVDADLHARYERIVKRQTETDRVSLEKFKEDNDREIGSADPARHNISSVIDAADFRIENDGTLEELQRKADAMLAEFRARSERLVG